MSKFTCFKLLLLMMVFQLSAISSCKKNDTGKKDDTEELVTPGQEDEEEEEKPLVKITPDVIVAKDGSGDYSTVQAAIDNSPRNRTSYYYIYIKKGTYKELITVPTDKPYLYFIGEDPLATILTYDNYASKESPGGGTYGTSGSASVFIRGNHFVAEKVTFANTAGISAGQALAINITGEFSAYRNCRFLGYQDTWLGDEGTKQYLKNCYIAGTVDFIFGGSTAYFQECEIYSERDGYVTAASTPQNQKYGYVFDRCTLTAAASVQDNKVYLGRPWRPYAHVVFVNCNMGAHIRLEGWHNWGDSANEATANYAEYNSIGPGYQAGRRVPWSRQLNSSMVELHYTKNKVLGNWSPFTNWELAF